MRFQSFAYATEWSTNLLLKEGKDVDAGSWQGYETRGRPDLVTKEILNLQLEVPVFREYYRTTHGREFDNLHILQQEIEPNLPWADDHFAERVSRVPSNPGEEYKNWPWWQGQNEQSMVAGTPTGDLWADSLVFTHTYQERFWPKYAGGIESKDGVYHKVTRNRGIRYDYGDLDDVVSLIEKNPPTRQATFPICFPEDTGSVHGGRTPCTLHYHFLMRKGKLHMWYAIRSCDLIRHFRDDLYLACRLLLWVLEELLDRELRSNNSQFWNGVVPGTLFFTAYSFHVHKGDLHHVHVKI